MVDLGIGGAIHIRESDDRPYFVIWSADTLYRQADSGRYFRVTIEQSPVGWRASVSARPDWAVEAPTRGTMKEELASLIADALRHGEELIARYIETDPHRPSEGNARLTNAGPSVWAIIGHLEGAHGNVRQVADDYDLPREAAATVPPIKRPTC